MSAALLLEAVRKAAKPGLWSRGVGLARARAVAVQSRSPGEVELRVRVPGQTVAPTVVLYLEDGDWECSCPALVDPCDHVVAAAISLNQAEQTDTPLAETQARWSRVVYRFSRHQGGLQLCRTLAHADGPETDLQGTLSALLQQPAQAALLQVEPWDLTADRLLERPNRGPLPPERLDALLRVLEPARTVLLDGRPVAVTLDKVLPVATLVDRGANVALTIAQDPRVEEVVSQGVVLCGDALCSLGETALTGMRLQNLPVTQVFSPEQLGELTARVLPDLAHRMPVEVHSTRLPPVDPQLAPRVLLDLTALDSGISVLPTLVYGSPPQVRVDAGRLVYLKGAVPVRDEAAEQRLVHKLLDGLNMVPGRRVTIPSQDLAAWVGRLKGWRECVTGDAAGLVSPHLALRPSLLVQGAQRPGGAPQVGFTLRFESDGANGSGQGVDAATVVKAWQEGLGLVQLDGGAWAPLPLAWLEQHGQRVADLLAAREESGRLANHALPQLADLCQTLECPPPPGLDCLAPLVDGFEGLAPPVLPSGLDATLRPYQSTGVAWLQFLQRAGLGGILADDMGLGKTLQALCALNGRSLVVCPTSVLPNWEAEIKRFRPDLSFATYHGPGRALDPAARITLTTYAIVRLDAAALSQVVWDGVVLDEAQAIKNPQSQVARAAFGLKAPFRVALSGTPLENRLEELWSLMHFCNPGLLGGRRDFDQRIGQRMLAGDANARKELQKRIRPFVLRRLKRDVAPELPPRTESVMWVTLDDRERTIYDTVLAASRKEVVAMLQGGNSGGMLRALEALLRLRQAACHPSLVPGQEAVTSSKVGALVDALVTAVDDGHKALVFSQWTSLLDLVEPALKSRGITFVRLDGSTRDRGEVTRQFQADGGPPVMLISLKAGGTGLNLTAADHVFLLDPWWNPAVEAQAADRAHRLGQERPVVVYRMVAKGTVEERILGLQERKRALFDAALGDAASAAALTRQDLLDLLA